MRLRLTRLMLIILLFTGIISTVFAEVKSPNNKINTKKKIVFVKDDDGEFFKAVGQLIGSLVEKKGWTKENSEYIVLSMEGKENKASEIIKKIIEIRPDVVFVNTTLIKPIAMKLKDAKIPCIAGGGLELEDNTGKMIFVDKNGNPTTNLTGTYTMPKQQLENSIKFLNMVAPINNKKAVFATFRSAAFTKSKVVKAFKNLNIGLKDYKEFNNVEDYQKFVKKYNSDKDVGWILSGEMISRHKDGRAYSFEEFFKWERENNKKPNIGFWENSVELGKLCALAIDSMTTVNQMVNMADRVLKGEKVSKIKPQDPQRTLIILNQARANDLGLVFPINILKSAWKIYIDYNGNFESKQ